MQFLYEWIHYSSNPINFMRNQLAYVNKDSPKKLLDAEEIQNLLVKLKYIYNLDSLHEIFFQDVR